MTDDSTKENSEKQNSPEAPEQKEAVPDAVPEAEQPEGAQALPPPAAEEGGLAPSIFSKKGGSGRGKIKFAKDKKQEDSASPASAQVQTQEIDKVPEPDQNLEKEATLKRGKLMGSFEIIEPLSLTGVCETYLAVSRITRRKFILRLFPPILADIDPDFAERFNTESAKLKELIHPNIVALRHSGREKNYYYLVTDFIDAIAPGQLTLENKIYKYGIIPEPQVKRIVQVLCKALEFAHNCKPSGVLHTDLKPSNIFFDKNNHIWLTDFSNINFIGKNYFMDIVKHVIADSFSDVTMTSGVRQVSLLSMLDEKDLEKTASVVILKTKKKFRSLFINIMTEYFHDMIRKTASLFKSKAKRSEEKTKERKMTIAKPIVESYDYLSPEQKAGQDATERSNVYSLGLIIYYMLTGEKITGKWSIPSKHGCCKKWDHVLLKCLQPDPMDRYSCVAEIQRAINEVEAKRHFVLPSVLITAGILFVALYLLLFKVDFSDSYGEKDLYRVLFKKSSASGLPVQVEAKIRCKVITIPAAEEIRIYFNGEHLKTLDNIPEEGIEMNISKGKYSLEALKRGYKTISEELPVKEKSDFVFEFSKITATQPVEKKYIYINDLQFPNKKHPWLIPGTNIEMLPVEPGTFNIGTDMKDPLRDANDIKAFTVTIPYTFWMAKFETQQKIYEEVMWMNPSLFKSSDGSLPVERLTWQNAMEFCKKLTQKEKTANRIPDGYAYRLPTEAEWEYCCRAGTELPYYFGQNKNELANYAWFTANSSMTTHRPGEKKPNGWGFYDMLGNVAEWCLDSFGGYPITPPMINLVKTRQKQTLFIARGGAWDKDMNEARCAARFIAPNGLFKRNDIGFRIVLAPLDIVYSHPSPEEPKQEETQE